MQKSGYCLSIAGLDPTGGAGILADIKTFEAIGVQGFGVSTATTYQNEHTFYGLDWMSFEQIHDQLEPLFAAYDISFAKIGLIENWGVLERTLAYLKKKNSDMIIVWDPILSSSSGYEFHSGSFGESNMELFKSIDLFTPNLNEMLNLFPHQSGGDMGSKLSEYCSVLLKGGHDQTEHSNDTLFQDRIKKAIVGERLPFDKHGTGCVLSAAIVTHLAMGGNMEESCTRAKEYVNKFLMSNSSLLGSHSLQNQYETYS